MKTDLRSAFRAIRRGCSLKDQLLIALVVFVVIPSRELLRRHPRLLHALSTFTDYDLCVRTATPNGPARVVFNASQACELIVANELLLHQLYLVEANHDAVIDIGAFRGSSTIYLADQVGTDCIVAVEPNHENVEILRRRLHIYVPRARLIEAAVGAQSGITNFTGSGVSGRISSDEGQPVKSASFSEVLAAGVFHNPVIKIDIEGYEETLLPSILPHLPRRCLMLLETHRGRAEAENLLDPLRSAGFTINQCSSKKNTSENDIYIDWQLER